jgi:DNA-directed RNA polymerase subunit RPC12/RpoP
MARGTTMTKCPNCGAELRFSPEKQKMLCDYCMSEFTPDEMSEAEKPVIETSGGSAPEQAVTDNEKKEFEEATRAYVCNNCGATIMSDENTAASECYYCHNPVTLTGRISGEFRPERLIPFKLNREEAEELFRKYIKKKWFVPKSFRSEKQLEKIVGLYTPFWLADCKTNAAISADAFIVNTHRSGDYTVTHTKVFDCDRAAYMTFEKIPADGSKKLDDDFLDAVEPFDYKELTEFNMNFLSGFMADKYDVPKSEIIERIKSRATGAALELLKDDIKGFSSVTVKTQSMNLIRTDWEYVMLPLWFMTYLYNGKIFEFAVNGQTGKIAGLPPMSGGKFALALVIIFILVMITGFFVAGFLGV